MRWSARPASRSTDVYVVMVVVPWLGDAWGLTRLTRYTIASPRGPPLSA